MRHGVGDSGNWAGRVAVGIGSVEWYSDWVGRMART